MHSIHAFIACGTGVHAGGRATRPCIRHTRTDAMQTGLQASVRRGAQPHASLPSLLMHHAKPCHLCPTPLQVFISYGAQSNGSLLQYYAFTERDNPNDVYAFEATIGGQKMQARLMRCGCLQGRVAFVSRRCCCRC